MLKKFITYYKPVRVIFFADMLCAFTVAVCDLFYPMITRNIINIYVPNQQFELMIKWLLVLGGISENKMIFSAILLLSAFFSAVYLLPILFTAFFQKSQDASMEENLDPSQKMLIPIVALTGIVLILGLFPNPVLGFIKGITQTIV